jgi:hypothetical protein
VRPCPSCAHPAPRFLPDASADAAVLYYRCVACGHVFALIKENPAAPPLTVAPGRPADPD